ncbi:hypothetical protein HF680_00800 [Brevundimonas sp. WCHBH090558]|uniref:hypothetical protein n=1 Tax=Brevundimonas huaxiensis TaxID=2725493 RepID=UPI00162592C0|nr:hypothetical protein [Brevundimonas huaxiensis]MBC1181197.1 hypothetical protein [Brevundimonas huaxiensis]
MGEARTPLFAYVDESGNTGRNIFDTAQPDYYTAALVSRGDFDRNYGDQVRAIAGKVGATAIHANELGLGRLGGEGASLEACDEEGRLALPADQAGSPIVECPRTNEQSDRARPRWFETRA